MIQNQNLWDESPISYHANMGGGGEGGEMGREGQLLWNGIQSRGSRHIFRSCIFMEGRISSVRMTLLACGYFYFLSSQMKAPKDHWGLCYKRDIPSFFHEWYQKTTKAGIYMTTKIILFGKFGYFFNRIHNTMRKLRCWATKLKQRQSIHVLFRQ